MTPNYEITEVPAAFEEMLAATAISKRDFAPIWNAKTPIHLSVFQLGGREILIATCSRIDWFIVRGVRRVQRLHDVPPRTNTGIDHASRAQLFKSRLVLRQSRALEDRFADPFKTKPGEILDGGFNEFGATTRPIQIVDSQNKFTLGRNRPFLRGPKSARVTQMEISSGRWRKPSAIRHAIFKSQPPPFGHRIAFLGEGDAVLAESVRGATNESQAPSVPHTPVQISRLNQNHSATGRARRCTFSRHR